MFLCINILSTYFPKGNQDVDFTTNWFFSFSVCLMAELLTCRSKIHHGTDILYLNETHLHLLYVSQ